MMNMVLDAHFDVLMDIVRFRSQGERKVFETRHLPELRAAGINTLICSIFIEDNYLPEMALRHALGQIAALREDIADSTELFAICTDTKQAAEATGQGKLALFLSLEGAEPIGSDLLLLRTFYDLGVRLMGLTWSRRNYAADGCEFLWADAPKRPGGLTKFGRRLVDYAQELGIIIDVSHINDAGFEDVAEMVKKPFIASHSNCRWLCDTARNLTDNQIKAIAASGGVIGMNCYSPFISEELSGRTVEKLLSHIEYIGKLAGYEHVGLGLDICDCLASAAEAYPRNPQAGDLFQKHSEVTAEFFPAIRARYPERVADMILGGNFLRVLEEVLG